MSDSQPQASGSSANPTWKKGKDWSAFEKEMRKEEAKAKESLEDEKGINELIQEIYEKGSDDVKKAMIKSFTESGGTVLNTDWEEVSQGKVQVKTPDGMEFKKW